MPVLPGDAGSQPVRFAPRAAPPPQFRGNTPAGGAFASPVGPNVPHAAQQQAIHQAALQPSGPEGGDASAQLQALAHARIVQQYIHNVGDHSGSLFKGLWNLPPQKQVPIVSMVLKETGLGKLGFQEGVEALSQHVNALDKAQLAEMNKAISYGHQPLSTSPQGQQHQQQATLQQAHADFGALLARGLLPTGAKFPSFIFNKGDPVGGGRSYVTNGKIHISPTEAGLLAQGPNPKSAMSNWAREGLIHEMTHTMQNATAASSVPLVEGGAQAYADQVAPAVLPNWKSWGDSTYAGYVQNARQSPGWFMRGQFYPPVHNPNGAPTLNMPGTSSYVPPGPSPKPPPQYRRR